MLQTDSGNETNENKEYLFATFLQIAFFVWRSERQSLFFIFDIKQLV